MRRHLTWLALVVLCWCTFWTLLNCDFINYDDDRYVYSNPQTLQGLTFDTVVWAFRTTEFYNWHPLTWLSFATDVEIFGKNPLGFHLTNLVLHTCNVVLVYVLFRQMTGNSLRSAVVAALFAIHPLHVETVAWVSERKGLLSTLFGLSALCAYGTYTRSGRWWWYAASLMAFALSLMAKQMLVTLPCLLLLLDYWPLERLKRHSALMCLLEKAPFFAVGAAMSAVVFWVQQLGGTVRSLAEYPFAVRCANAVLAYGLYLLKTIWPSALSVHYPHPGSNIDTPVVAVAVLGLLAISVGTIIARHRHPYLLVGWLWFVGTLVPVIGLVQIGDQQMADRYTYVPLIGLFFGAVWWGGSLAERGPSSRVVVSMTAGMAILVFGVLSYRHALLWQSSITLFEHAIGVTQNNAIAHYNLASAYARSGNDDLAIEHYQATLEIRPADAGSHYSLGVIAERQDRVDDALQHYRQAIEIDAHYAAAHTNLAVRLERQGKLEAALEHYQRAVEYDPADAQAQFNLAVFWRSLARQRRQPELYDRALPYARAAAAMRPSDPNSNALLGDVLLDLGRFDEAIEQFSRVLVLSADDTRAHEGIGVALVSLGRFDEAIRPLLRVLELKPTPFRKQALTEAYLGAAHQAIQNQYPRRAFDHLMKLMQFDPNSARGHLALGRVYLELGEKTTAVRHFRVALRLDPSLDEARQMLEEGRLD